MLLIIDISEKLHREAVKIKKVLNFGHWPNLCDPPPLSNFGHLILKKLLLQESTLHPLKHVLNKTCFKQNLFFLSLLVTRIMIFVAMFQYLTAGKVAATPYTMPPHIWIYDFLMFISCFRWYRSI